MQRRIGTILLVTFVFTGTFWVGAVLAPKKTPSPVILVIPDLPEVPTVPLAHESQASVSLPQASVPKKVLEYEMQLKKVFNDLPKTKDLKNLSEEEIHNHPAAMEKAALELGELAEKTKAHPEFLSPTLEFYDQCAKKDELLLAVRALCLRDLRVRAAIGTYQPKSYSAEVVELSEQIPN